MYQLKSSPLNSFYPTVHLGRKKGGKGAIFHAFCVVCARAREDLVEAVEAAADFLVLAPGALELQSSRSNRLSA